MLMNDKITFDLYYCINSAETKEIRCRNERNMVHYILQPHHIFIRVKALVFYARSGRTSVSHSKHVLCVAPGNEHK